MLILFDIQFLEFSIIDPHFLDPENENGREETKSASQSREKLANTAETDGILRFGVRDNFEGRNERFDHQK